MRYCLDKLPGGGSDKLPDRFTARGVAARGERWEIELLRRPEGLLAGSFQTNEEVGINLEEI